jgi:hypothetical protein
MPTARWGIAGAGWREEDNVFGFGEVGEEYPGAQVRDEVPLRGGLMVEVELFQVLMGRETCGLDPCGRSRGFAFGDFPGEVLNGQIIMLKSTTWYHRVERTVSSR